MAKIFLSYNFSNFFMTLGIEQLRLSARKVALVHEMALHLTNYGRKEFSLEELYEKKLKPYNRKEDGVSVTIEETETILDELRERTFVSRSAKKPYTYIIQIRCSVDISNLATDSPFLGDFHKRVLAFGSR